MKNQDLPPCAPPSGQSVDKVERGSRFHKSKGLSLRPLQMDSLPTSANLPEIEEGLDWRIGTNESESCFLSYWFTNCHHQAVPKCPRLNFPILKLVRMRLVTSWWFQPIWEILVRMGSHLRGDHSKNTWNHHPGEGNILLSKPSKFSFWGALSIMSTTSSTSEMRTITKSSHAQTQSEPQKNPRSQRSQKVS